MLDTVVFNPGFDCSDHGGSVVAAKRGAIGRVLSLAVAVRRDNELAVGYVGRVYDRHGRLCASAGCIVQSAEFVAAEGERIAATNCLKAERKFGRIVVSEKDADTYGATAGVKNGYAKRTRQEE